MTLSRPGQWEGFTWLIITALCISPSLAVSVNSFQYCQPWICSCYMDGIYYDAGQTWTKKGEPCTTYKCHDNGSFTPDVIGVEFSDKTCKYLNETWSVGCFKYGVVFDGYKAKYRLLEGGCRADNGDCLLVGDRVVQACDTYECQIEGTCYSLVKVVSGCSSVNHGCQMLHSVWHDHCAVYQCIASDLGSTIKLHYHEVMLWPRGYYGLLRPIGGCPDVIEETWYDGVRIHYSEGGNYYSDPYLMDGNHTENLMEHKFCLHENQLRPDFMPIYQTFWDPGRYCILRVNGSCPRNFTEGYIKMIDFSGNVTFNGVEIPVESSSEGILPDGEYDDNSTLLQFCCRDDGELDKALLLPSGKPFVLFMAENETECQDVRAMEWDIEHFSFADDGEGYERELNGTIPRTSTSDNNTLIYLCHYKPLTCGCVYENGDYVTLGSIYQIDNGCIKYKCVEQEIIQKNILQLESAGCYENNKCVIAGESKPYQQGESCYERTCVQKENPAKNFYTTYWEFENIPSGCRNEGSCVPNGTVITNGCFKKMCVINDGVPKFEVITEGCTSGDTCIPVGQNITTNECVTLQCQENLVEKRSELAVVKGGCMFGGKCHAKGAVWRHDCIDYVCEEFKDDAVVKYFEKQTQIYCADNNGTCHEMGSIVKYKCWDYECVVNGRYRNLVIVGGGCSHLGRCHKSGEIWKENCSNFTCKTYNNETYFKASVEYVDPACELKNGTCIPAGTNVTEGCSVRQCRKNDLECGLVAISGACSTNDGKCIDVGSTFKLGCSTYKCNKYDNQIRLEPVIGGCNFNNTCYDVGARFNQSCKEYECQTSNGYYQVVMISKGCLVGDGCMKADEVRIEGCYKKKCTVTTRSCRVHYIEADCTYFKNGQKTCVPVNSTVGTGCSKFTCEKTGPAVHEVKLVAAEKACSYEGQCYEINKNFVHPKGSFCMKFFCDSNGYSQYKETICRSEEGKCIPVGSTEKFNTIIQIYRGKDCTCGSGGSASCNGFEML